MGVSGPSIRQTRLSQAKRPPASAPHAVDPHLGRAPGPGTIINLACRIASPVPVTKKVPQSSASDGDLNDALMRQVEERQSAA
jgi:hypothetical protein